MGSSLDGRISRRDVFKLAFIEAAAPILTSSLATGKQAMPQEIVSPFSGVDLRYALPIETTPLRPHTLFIMYHFTEGNFENSLNTLLPGRTKNRLIEHGKIPKAHLIIDADGIAYQLAHPDHYANHAGVTMWRGIEDLSLYSLGIEIVDNRRKSPMNDPRPHPPTTMQYQTLRRIFLEALQRYQLSDRGIIGHYQAAYEWEKVKRVRGRKLDGIDLEASKVGLRLTRYDPDVAEGRVFLGSKLQRFLEARRNLPVVKYISR